MENWEKVFNALTRTAVYAHVAPLATKREILCAVWQEEIPCLTERYDQRGIGANDEVGFGFLVEAFAKRSPKVPRNSKAGERLAKLLISVMQSGDSTVGVGRKLQNPDLIWVENTGRRAVITGIGEIKSSVQALSQRLEQLTNFESGLRIIAKKIQRDKDVDRTINYLRRKKVELANPLKKLLVLPNGEKAKAKWLPAGWEVLEIEFSYDELVFIAQQVWPEFRKDFKPGEGYLPRYEREFTAKLVEWGKLRFNKIFARTTLQPFPTHEYLLYALAIGELPLADRQVELATACVKEADPALSFPPQLLNPASLSVWERKFMKYFCLLWGEGEENKKYILHFLHDRRSFVARLREILGHRDIKALLCNEAAVLDLLDT